MVSSTQENEEGNGGIQRGAGGQAAGDTTQTMGAFAPGFSVGTAVNQQAVTPATGLRGLMALAPHFGEEEICLKTKKLRIAIILDTNHTYIRKSRA
jgi:hypothetical protein